MIKTPKDLLAMHADALEASGAALAKAMEGMQRLAELNMRTIKAAMGDSATQMKALLGARDPQAISKLMTSLARPSTEPLRAYAKEAYEISRETTGELAAMLQQQLAATNRQLAGAIDALTQSAPAGTEGAVRMLRQALSAANKAYEQSGEAARKLAEAADERITQAVKAAPAARPAAKAAPRAAGRKARAKAPRPKA